MLPPGLQRRVDRIAAAEGCSSRAIVLTAVRELVRAFPGPAPRRRVAVEVRHVERPRKRRGMAHTSAPPLRASMNPPEPQPTRCTRCDHRDVEHDEGGGKCLIIRCGCAEFYA